MQWGGGEECSALEEGSHVVEEEGELHGKEGDDRENSNTKGGEGER